MLLSLPGSLPLLALLLSLRHKTLPVVMISLTTSPICRSNAKCPHTMTQPSGTGQATAIIIKRVLS